MQRRIHVPILRVGLIELDEQQSHHARDVLRLPDGATVEVFDDAGNVGGGILHYQSPSGCQVQVSQLQIARSHRPRLLIASAVPKGERADWMIEKLSELGADEFVPLRTERAVVLPEGSGKLDRWKRIAIESAKQSRRPGVMQIRPLTDVKELLDRRGYFLSTESNAPPFSGLEHHDTELRLLIGPEGGWSEKEMALFRSAHLTGLSLGPTILRVETAAIAGAVLAMNFLESL